MNFERMNFFHFERSIRSLSYRNNHKSSDKISVSICVKMQLSYRGKGKHLNSLKIQLGIALIKRRKNFEVKTIQPF